MKILDKKEQKNIKGGRKPSPRDCERCAAYCNGLPSSEQGGCAESYCFGCDEF